MTLPGEDSGNLLNLQKGYPEKTEAGKSPSFQEIRSASSQDPDLLRLM